MSAMLLSWLAFPAVLGVLSLGCGLFLERAAGLRLTGALVLPVGFSTLVVAGTFSTMRDATAELAVPLIVVLAVAGLALSFPWRNGRFDAWALSAAVAVFAAFAAPVVLSGEATFAGYIKLDDTSVWLAHTDRIMEFGRNLDGLAPSSYEATLASWLGSGYPIGSFLGLGVGHELLGEDSAWLYQPYLAFLAALLALVCYALVGPLIRSRALRVLTVFLASQPALLYGYALWGGVKELATAPMVALAAALVPPLFRKEVGIRATLPLAMTTAATFAIVSVTGGVWLLPLGVAAVVLAVTLALKRFAVLAISFAALTLSFSIPALALADTFLRAVEEGGVLRLESELGNLVEPLNPLQMFGVWPTGDFRFDPEELELTYVLITVVALAGAAGLFLAGRARSFGLPLYVGGAGIGAAASALVGSPWVDAKAFTIASPAFVLVALAAAAVVFEQGRRVEATVAAAAIAGGVLWSNVLAYHEVWLAPRDQLAELEGIGERIAGQGPTLMTEFQPYGVRHFLREADPEGAGELRRRLVPLRDGSLLPKGEFADIDRFDLAGLLEYRTLVLRRSPLASRPPSAFELTWEGRYYEIWQRSNGSPRIVEHLPLGDEQPAATPPCGQILRLARQAGPNGQLAAVFRSPAYVVELGPGGLVFSQDAFQFAQELDLPLAGRYDVWVGSELRSKVEVSVRGRVVGSARHHLKPGLFTWLGQDDLAAGRQRVRLRYTGPDLRPGSGGRSWFGLGPVVLSRSTAARPFVYVPPQSAHSLCGKSLDWIEAVGR